MNLLQHIGGFIKNNPLGISILTSSIYMACYLYQAAYLHFYGIDSGSVHISLDTLLLLGSSTLITALIVAPLFSMFMHMTEGNKQNGFWGIVALEILILGEFYFIFMEILLKTDMFQGTHKIWLLPIVVLAARTFTACFKINSLDTRNFKERYVADKKKTFKFDAIILFCGALIFMAVISGNSSATSKQYYKVAGDFAVISEDGDHYLMIKLEKGHPTGDYKYLPKDDELNFKMKRIDLNQKTSFRQKVNNLKSHIQ